MKSPVHLYFPLAALRNWSVLALLLFLLSPAHCKAQEIGQVECARSGDYVYLYSSMVSLDIRGTLQCGQQVEITGRYDSYFGVRTAKGETGYVPQNSLLLLKSAPGSKPVLAPSNAPVREKIHYDQPGSTAPPPSNAPDPSKIVVLLDSTPVHMKLGRELSSATAQVGDEVNLEVDEDVVIDGLLIIPKGANALGVVNEAEPKKALGRGGKLSILVRSVRLANNDQAVLRSGGEAKGASSSAGVVIPVMRGKDVIFPKGMEITAYVNGDNRLKRQLFRPATEGPDAPPTGKVTNIQHP